jgi:acetolactate synthase regulatory subunit
MPSTHSLELVVTDGPVVLDRIVSVCRSRRCTVLWLRFHAADRHRSGRVSIGLRADERRARLATRHLAELVEVLGVSSDERYASEAGEELDVGGLRRDRGPRGWDRGPRLAQEGTGASSARPTPTRSCRAAST